MATGMAGGRRRGLRNRDPVYGPLLLAALSAPFVLLIAFGMIYPLVGAVHGSIVAGDGTGSEYTAVVGNDVFWIVLRRTFESALTVALICAVIGYFIAEMIASAPRWLRPVLLAAVIIPLWSSSVARSYSWLGVFQRDAIADDVASLFGLGPLQLLFTRPAVVVGMVHVMLPFLVIPLYATLIRYDQRLSQASLSLGAGRLRTFMAVKLPVIAPEAAAATVAVFILSLGFYITPAVLGGPRASMISNLIYDQVFTRFDIERGYAIAVILLITTLAAALAAAAVLGVMRKRRA